MKDENNLLKVELDNLHHQSSSLANELSLKTIHQSELSDFLSVLKMSQDALNSEKAELTRKMDELLKENQNAINENNKLILAMLKIKEDSMEKQNDIMDIMNQLKQRASSIDKEEEEYEVIDCESKPEDNYRVRNTRIFAPHKLLVSFKAHEVEGITLAFNANGSVLLTSGNEKSLKTWDYLCGSEKQSFFGSNHAILSVAVAESNDLVLAGSSSGEGFIWNSFNLKLKHKLNGHVGKVNGTGFVKFGREAVTGAEDRTVKFWDVTRGYCTRSVQVSSAIYTLTICKEDSSIITGHKDGNLMILYPKSSKLTKLCSESSAISGCCLSPCGNYLGYLTRNHKIIVRDLRMMEVLARLGHKNFLCPGTNTAISFSLDSKFLTSGSFNGKVFTWRMDGNCDSVLQAGEKPVLAVQWHPCESQVVSLDYSGNLSVWA